MPQYINEYIIAIGYCGGQKPAYRCINPSQAKFEALPRGVTYQSTQMKRHLSLGAVWCWPKTLGRENQ